MIECFYYHSADPIVAKKILEVIDDISYDEKRKYFIIIRAMKCILLENKLPVDFLEYVIGAMHRTDTAAARGALQEILDSGVLAECNDRNEKVREMISNSLKNL